MCMCMPLWAAEERILHKQQDNSLQNICHVVTACCILHNYCLAHGDEGDDDWISDHDGDDSNDDDDDDDHHHPQANSEADDIRETLLQYLQ